MTISLRIPELRVARARLRVFIKLPRLALLVLGCTALLGLFPSPAADKPVGGGCDGCELMFEGIPGNLNWQTTITESESGEPLEMEGVIYQPDGKTPAPAVILYVYHTNAAGFYAPAPEQTAARRHGQMRGWVKTDANGRYRFRTIRPAPYPNREVPAHIHPIVKEADKSQYYIDEYLFDDDPLLTKEKRNAQEGRGGSGIVRLTKNADGIWLGRRDIVLGRNIPDYR